MKSRGFTLIEALIVVMILGILISVAAPHLLNEQEPRRAAPVVEDRSLFSPCNSMCEE